MATPLAAAAAKTRGQSAVTPGREPNMRPRGWPRTWTPGAVTAASIRGVWSAADRSTACGAATTMSKQRPVGRLDVDRAVGADVRLDAGEQPEGAAAVAIQPIDLGALRGEARRRQAVGDRQPAGVIGDRAPGVAAAAAGLDDLLERLAAVAPRRVHLQIAAIVGEARAAQAGVAVDGADAGAAQEVRAQARGGARPRRALAAGVDHALDHRRGAGRQHLLDHARRRRADPRDPRQRAVRLHERLERLVEREDRVGGLLVAPGPLRRRLRDGEIAQQAGDDQVGVGGGSADATTPEWFTNDSGVVRYHSGVVHDPLRSRRGHGSTGGSGASAGPEITCPRGVNRDPWHGQSHVRSAGFQPT